MKKLFAVRDHSSDISTVLFLIRLVMGYAFILHGWGKVQAPMSWMGPDAAVPGIIQALGAYAEFGGGILLIIGLFTGLASLGILITMMVAIFMHAFIMGDPFVSKGGGSFELASIYFLISLLFIVMGPGRFSTDHKVFSTRTRG